MSDRKKIELSKIIEDLENGYTRLTSSVGYTSPKSIGEKYDLRNSQVNALFSHPKLKGLRTKFPKDPGFDIIDDTVLVTVPVAGAVVEGVAANPADTMDTETNEASPWDEAVLLEDMDATEAADLGVSN